MIWLLALIAMLALQCVISLADILAEKKEQNRLLRALVKADTTRELAKLGIVRDADGCWI